MLDKLKLIKRKIKYWFQRRIRGWSDDETWDLNYEFMKWVNSRFKQYKKEASKIVELDFHKFKYKRKEYTQIELIDKIIQLSDYVVEDDWESVQAVQKQLNAVNEIFDIFKTIYWVMWW